MFRKNHLFESIWKDLLNSLNQEFLGGNEPLNLHKEEMKYDKGDYITTVVNYFDESGYCVHTQSTTISKNLLPSKENDERKRLEGELQKALELDTPEGYTQAAEIKKQLTELKTNKKEIANG